MFQGIDDRLRKEMHKLVPENFTNDVKIIAPPSRKYSAWIGGTILSNLGSFYESWITKTEYEEYGPAVVHRKCNN